MGSEGRMVPTQVAQAYCVKRVRLHLRCLIGRNNTILYRTKYTIQKSKINNDFNVVYWCVLAGFKAVLSLLSFEGLSLGKNRKAPWERSRSTIRPRYLTQETGDVRAGIALHSGIGICQCGGTRQWRQTIWTPGTS